MKKKEFIEGNKWLFAPKDFFLFSPSVTLQHYLHLILLKRIFQSFESVMTLSLSVSEIIAISFHYTICPFPFPEFMHGNCLRIFQWLMTLQSLHSSDNSSFKETRLCPLNLTISSYSAYLNSFYFWPFLLSGLIETHRNCITESCVRIKVEIFY